jgi:hypothetical protein
MSKFKKYQEQVNSLEYAIRKIEDIQKSELPIRAKEVIKEALTNLKNITIAQPALEKASGDLLDPAKVKGLLEDATEYKWRVVPKKEMIENFGLDDEEYTLKEFVADNYGMEVEDKDVQLLGFYRNTDNRSELCRVDIVCIPGHFQCNWANDRASVGDDLMPNSKFEKFIQRIR